MLVVDVRPPPPSTHFSASLVLVQVTLIFAYGVSAAFFHVFDIAVDTMLVCFLVVRGPHTALLCTQLFPTHFARECATPVPHGCVHCARPRTNMITPSFV